jgi:hypothetical protein
MHHYNVPELECASPFVQIVKLKLTMPHYFIAYLLQIYPRFSSNHQLLLLRIAVLVNHLSPITTSTT